MNKFIEWMNNAFAPKMSKIIRNPWISAIQDTMMAIMPIILISSFISIISALSGSVTFLPDVSYMSNYSIGICSLFVSYLIPTIILEKKKKSKYKKQAGCLGIALFIMMSAPVIEDGLLKLSLDRLGAGGIFVGIVAGMIVAFVMIQCTKFSLFKKDSTMPKFLVDSFDSITPILIIMIFGFVVCSLLNIDLYALISACFDPIIAVSLSFGGFIIINFLSIFLYTFGISTWLIYGLYYPIYLNAVIQNSELVAAGQQATYIATNETMFLVHVGGVGFTLTLGIMFAFFAKSKKLKGLGRTTLIPSLFNINEPLIFGSVAFNPILMIPAWIVGTIIPIITWVFMSTGIVTIPSAIFAFWYAPFPFSFFVNYDWKVYILVIVCFAVSSLIYFPFFKVYDRQCIEEEKAALEEEKVNKI